MPRGDLHLYKYMLNYALHLFSRKAQAPSRSEDGFHRLPHDVLFAILALC